MIYINNIKEKKVNILKKCIIAADFETILINNEHYVFAIGFKDDVNYKHFYLKDNYSQDKDIINASFNMVKEFIYELLNLYKKPYVYFHNLGAFDGIFILKCIDNIAKDGHDFNCIIRNNKIYKIQYKSITFLDSILLINDKLDNIAKNFLNTQKISINYNSLNTYNLCIKNKDNIIKYLYKDIEILYNIIYLFFNKYFLLYKVDITKNFTIPSIAFYIYRKNYLNGFFIYISSKFIYKFIKKSYFGGINNILIPKIKKGYVYDVNSLYPFIMKTFPMPLGKPIWIYKNFKDINEYFGFIECEIYVPKNIKVPPLSIKHKNTLIQPNGYINGVFFIEEIINSINKYKCKIIKILKICHFEKKDIIFKDYINDMYLNRLNSVNKIDNYIYKLLMNSLYGRFGIDENILLTKIVNNENKWLYELVYNIEIEYENSNLITYKNNEDNLNNLKNLLEKNIFNNKKNILIKSEIHKITKNKKFVNTAIQISAAISAYARIYMTNIINNHINKKNKIFYFDTDSIHTNKPLAKFLLHKSKLGKFKLEYKIKRGYYLAPKIYTLKIKNNKTIYRFKGLKIDKKLNFNWYKKIFLNIKYLTYKKNYIKHIYKNLKTLKIIKKYANYQTNFNTKKYIKLYNKKNIWIKNKNIFIKK